MLATFCKPSAMLMILMIFLSSKALSAEIPTLTGTLVDEINDDSLCIVKWKKDKYQEAVSASNCKKGDWLVARGNRSTEPYMQAMFVAENCVMDTVIYFQYGLHPSITHCVYRGEHRKLSGSETQLNH